MSSLQSWIDAASHRCADRFGETQALCRFYPAITKFRRSSVKPMHREYNAGLWVNRLKATVEYANRSSRRNSMVDEREGSCPLVNTRLIHCDISLQYIS